MVQTTTTEDQAAAQIPQFPFEGLHVYRRAREAAAIAAKRTDDDGFADAIRGEIRAAVLSIAAATAQVRTGDERGSPFAQALIHARQHVFRAGATVHLAKDYRRATWTASKTTGDDDETLLPVLQDTARMLGALVRSCQKSGEENS